MVTRHFSRTLLLRQLRSHVAAQLYDESELLLPGVAIYTLSDPRSPREVRYVGQSRSPRRRFLQHLQEARLWLPDELPWWIESPALRPLYEWIRQLYCDGERLPTMIVGEWVSTESAARLAERARIRACLKGDLPLLNVQWRLDNGQFELF
jgi:hypothetical protein